MRPIRPRRTAGSCVDLHSVSCDYRSAILLLESLGPRAISWVGEFVNSRQIAVRGSFPEQFALTALFESFVSELVC